MKYCVHCGKQLDDQADYCTGCGVKCVDKTLQEQNVKANKTTLDDDKPLQGKTVGVLLGIFASIVGLILVILLGDEECKKSGIKAFVITTVCIVAVSLIIAIIAIILVATGVIAANPTYTLFM